MLHSFLLAIIPFLLTVSPVQAHLRGSTRFTEFFPLLRPELTNISTNTCAPTLSVYLENQNRLACDAHINCILSNMAQLDQIDMTNAGILLGLLPILIASFGPTIAEIALLSSRRPLLSFLLSVGVPAIFIIRPMAYADPLELLTPVRGEFTIPPFTDKRVALGISAAEYLIVSLAIGNIFWVSYELQLRTVLTWKCLPFMPVVWALLPGIIHLLAAWTFNHSAVMRRVKLAQQTDNLGRRDSLATRFFSRLRTEFILCANQEDQTLQDTSPEVLTVTLNWLATVMGSVHVIFGIVVFAGLLFISLLDASIVAVRYMLSILVCRLVLKFEISGARGTTKLMKREDALRGMELQRRKPWAGTTASIDSQKMPIARMYGARRADSDEDSQTMPTAGVYAATMVDSDETYLSP
ncbi:MAG: hypothetical protein Q9161_002565 [Pseudevernia consocians]